MSLSNEIIPPATDSWLLATGHGLLSCRADVKTSGLGRKVACGFFLPGQTDGVRYMPRKVDQSSTKKLLALVKSYCRDLGWDPVLQVEILSWALNRWRLQALRPEEAVLARWLRQRNCRALAKEHLERETHRTWKVAEVNSFLQEWKTWMHQPDREPIRFEDLVTLLIRAPRKCANCGAQPPAAVLHIDHKKPVKRGGTSTYPNIQFLCENCNLRKGTAAWYYRE